MPELVFFRRGEEVLRVGLGRERMVLGRGATRSAPAPRQREPGQRRGDGDRCQDDPGEG